MSMKRTENGPPLVQTGLPRIQLIHVLKPEMCHFLLASWPSIPFGHEPGNAQVAGHGSCLVRYLGFHGWLDLSGRRPLWAAAPALAGTSFVRRTQVSWSD